MSRSSDSLADWFVGGAGKRKLLAALMAAPPGRRFTQKELADAADLHDKGSVVRHLAVLERAGLLARDAPGGTYRVRRWRHRAALTSWLAELDQAESTVAVWRRPLPPSRGGR